MRVPTQSGMLDGLPQVGLEHKASLLCRQETQLAGTGTSKECLSSIVIEAGELGTMVQVGV